jgi:putative tricarboxylic transport membrane protein
MKLSFDQVVLIALFCFGALLFAGTFVVETGAGASRFDVGSRFAPQLFSGALMVFSALALIFKPRDEDYRLGADAIVAVVVLLVIGYAVALPVLGYVISTFATLLLVLIAVRAGAWWRILAFSAGMTAALYFIFERVMLVGLPAGPLKF